MTFYEFRPSRFSFFGLLVSILRSRPLIPVLLFSISVVYTGMFKVVIGVPCFMLVIVRSFSGWLGVRLQSHDHVQGDVDLWNRRKLVSPLPHHPVQRQTKNFEDFVERIAKQARLHARGGRHSEVTSRRPSHRWCLQPGWTDFGGPSAQIHHILHQPG